MADLKCAGCTKCCRGDLVRLLPADNPDQYLTFPHPVLQGQLALQHKPNGDCVYLGESGCLIHTTKPIICQEMDCRNIAKNLTFTQARKLDDRGLLRLEVWKQGKTLLNLTSA
jgi:hypothetical protein